VANKRKAFWLVCGDPVVDTAVMMFAHPDSPKLAQSAAFLASEPITRLANNAIVAALCGPAVFVALTMAA
jgi:hypothetical protein